MRSRLLQMRQRTYRMLSMATSRRRFSYFSSSCAYPYIEALCTFENASQIRLGNQVRFMKGCCVLANDGKIEIGDNTTICRFSVIQSVGGTIKIGSGSLIGDFCNLFGQGGLYIGNNVAIASCVQIVPNQHTFEDPVLPVSMQPCSSAGIRINDDCWIGTNVVILDGVEVGRGAIIGAGSIVTRDIRPILSRSACQQKYCVAAPDTKRYWPDAGSMPVSLSYRRQPNSIEVH